MTHPASDSKHMARLALAGLLAVSLGACGGPPAGGGPRFTDIQPKKNFYLRPGGPDKDPSAYLGRFVPAGTADSAIDDAEAMQTECSQYFAKKVVPAGGVTMSEYFAVSGGGGASFGVPPVAVQVGGERTNVLKVDYTQTEKWIAEIPPEKRADFDACCAKAPSNCTDRYIGEFLAGTGTFFGADSSSGGAQVSTLQGSAGVSDGMEWRRGMELKEPNFFAFRVTRRGTGNDNVGPVVSLCQRTWDLEIPKGVEGQYFVGTSKALDDESMARDDAMDNARRQIVKWLGEQIQQKRVEVQGFSGSGADLTTRLTSEENITRASGGVASLVKDECWKVETSTSPTGRKYHVKALALIPAAVTAQAAAAVLGAAK